MTATAHHLSQRNLDERIALRGPRDEIKELADTFDEMLGRLAAAFDAQRRFVANASHELRTPLTRLRALIDVSLADPDADAAALRAMAERVQAAAEDQERLIDGLLTLAQGERGLDRAQPIDLADLVTSLLPATASRHPGPHQPQILTELGPAVTAGDRDLLARLVANLIDNALSYNIADGWVRIRTGYQDGQATLQVTNTGPVLPAEVVPTLVEPFRRQVPIEPAPAPAGGAAWDSPSWPPSPTPTAEPLTWRLERAADFRSRLGCSPSHQPGNSTGADITPQAAHPIRCCSRWTRTALCATLARRWSLRTSSRSGHMDVLHAYAGTAVRCAESVRSALPTSPPTWPPQTTLPPA